MTNKNGWQLSGTAPAVYEKVVVPAFSGEWAKDLVKRAELKEGERVLDVGCGTGIVARIARSFLDSHGQITGIDINSDMIKMAREISEHAKDSIHWKECDVSALPLQDDTFDAVLCQQGLQYFSDRVSALKEIHRVLAVGGRIVLSYWRPIRYFPFYTILYRALERYVGEASAATLASAFSIGDNESLRSLVRNIHFKHIRIRLVIKQMYCPSLKAFFFGLIGASPYANDFFALNETVQMEMFNFIKNGISDYMDDDGLVAPMECYVLTAMK